MHLRLAANTDHSQVATLVDSVYREYGDRLFLEGADGDLLDLEGNYAGRGGAFVVLDDEGRVRGTQAALPLADTLGVCTFRRLFLDPDLRGGGWGERLMQWSLDWAREHEMRRVEFWSDTRFTRAHAFFARLGFTRGEVREMDDGAMPYQEYAFSMDLT